MNIPFYSNTGDGTHCWQAALKMALAVFEPEQEYSFEVLDRISAKIPGKWTWPTAAMLWLIKRGYRLQLIEEFDYHALALRGEAYVLEKCGEEVGRAQIAHSDMKSELAYAKAFAEIAPLEVRLPDFSDLKRLLQEQAVVICNINAAMLSQQHGYAGHFVVICDIGKRSLTIHDPGLPPQPSYRISLKDFDKAWSYPTPHERNLLAIQKPAVLPKIE